MSVRARGLKHLQLAALLILALVLTWARPVWAGSQLIQVDAQGPVYIRADRVEYDEKAKVYSAEGEVEITRGSTRLMADRVLLHSQTLTAEAEGRARLTMPGHVLTGQRILVDMQAGTGKIYDGRIFVESSHYYLHGREIEKTGRDTYRMREGAFTTCDGSKPDWEFSAQEMEVTLEGYGTAKQAAFRFKDIPLLWTPYIFFPAKFKRQSGLLAPQWATTDRDGFIFSQPYFQTLGEDQDLTFTLTYMSKRGLDLGLEYRYNLEPGSKGMFMMDYLHRDDQAQDLYDQGDLAEPYGSRYWFRGMVDQRLFDGKMFLSADIDWVSDQDYLREFEFGNTGFNQSNRRLADWFGRELEPRTSLLRENKVNLRRSWAAASFNATATYWDNLATNNDTTLQELPKLSLDATRQPVGDTGLYFQMGSSYVYDYREQGSRGHVIEVAPKLSLPFNFNDYLYLEPSFTYKQRLFNLEGGEDQDPSTKTSGATQIWNAQIKASTYMFRVYHFGSPQDPLAIKHGMRPYLTWEYQPDMGDDQVDELARLSQQRKNRFAYGIKNSFTYKIIAPDDKTGELRPQYFEFLRLSFFHEFDYAEYRRNRDGHFWGNLGGRLELELPSYLYLEADSTWSPYDNRFETVNARVIARDQRGDSVTVDYRQEHEGVHQVNTRFTLAVNEEWSLSYYNRKDLVEEIDFEQRYEVKYEGQCWGVKLFYLDTHYRERGVWLVFSLGGFGEVFDYGIQSGGQEENP